MMIQNAMVFCALILMGLAPSFPYLMIGRLLHGYSLGALTGVIPVYISEICQPPVRSSLGGVMNSFFTLSQATTFTIGAMLPWRQLLLVCSGAPLLIFILLIFASETPTWHVIRYGHYQVLE